jgi:hypothetical protein
VIEAMSHIGMRRFKLANDGWMPDACRPTSGTAISRILPGIQPLASGRCKNLWRD